MTRSRATVPARPIYDECPCRRRALSTFVRVEHGADRVDGKIESARDLTVCGLEAIATRGLRVEIGGELGSIGAKRLALRCKLVLAVIRLAAALRRCFERVECRGQAAARCVDCARVIHGISPPPAAAAPASGNIGLSKELLKKPTVCDGS